MKNCIFLFLFVAVIFGLCPNVSAAEKTRIIVTSDGEIDNECSMVCFLLYANEWNIEGIITSSSQYHWQRHQWAGDDWIDPYLEVYVKAEGDMEKETEGSAHIVKVLLDKTDDRPGWVQAWGGPNTIARALKTIEEKHPERISEIAKKLRFFFIWEQDYIRPHWGKDNICVKSYEKADHPPIVVLAHALDLKVHAGDRVELNTQGTTDPDEDMLTYHWWQYQQADSYVGISG